MAERATYEEGHFRTPDSSEMHDFMVYLEQSNYDPGEAKDLMKRIFVDRSQR